MLAGPAEAAISEQDRILLQMGLVAVREAPKPVELWQEHWPAVQLFDALLTQWSMSPTGRRTGLRYEAAAAAMDLIDDLADLPAARRREVFADLQIMELAALEHWRLTTPPPPRA